MQLLLPQAPDAGFAALFRSLLRSPKRGLVLKWPASLFFKSQRKSKTISEEFCLLGVVTLSLLDVLWSLNDQINLFLAQYLWDQLPCNLNTGSGLFPRL